MSSGGGVGRALDRKARSGGAFTRASIVWVVAAILLIPYEILCIVRGVQGGPLTHVVKWAYGPQYEPRWWLLGWPVSAAIAWTIPHFLFQGLGLRSLLTFVFLGLAVGVAGYLITR